MSTGQRLLFNHDYESHLGCGLRGGVFRGRAFGADGGSGGGGHVSLRHPRAGRSTGGLGSGRLLAERPAGRRARLRAGARRAFHRWAREADSIPGQQCHVRNLLSRPCCRGQAGSAHGSLGINCIRFHHADNQAAPRGIWKAGTPKKNEFDPGQLDRLDYFIAALKREGVYANINLHVSRNYWEGEDFPDGLAGNRERQEQLPHYGKGIDKINDQMIRMQRDYARALLTHVNPYTKTSYAKEPCVAIVELNNENSLLQLKVASLPEYYRAGVMRKWNLWLRARYGSTEKLAAAWGGSEPLGMNLLPERPAIQGSQYLAAAAGEAGEAVVSLLQAPEVSWHAQLHWGGLTLEEGQLYARVQRALRISRGGCR